MIHATMIQSNRLPGKLGKLLLYTMKASKQKSFMASCTRRPSRKNFRGTPLKYIYIQCHLEISYKKVLLTCKKVRKVWNFSASKLSWYMLFIRLQPIIKMFIGINLSCGLAYPWEILLSHLTMNSHSCCCNCMDSWKAS